MDYFSPKTGLPGLNELRRRNYNSFLRKKSRLGMQAPVRRIGNSDNAEVWHIKLTYKMKYVCLCRVLVAGVPALLAVPFLTAESDICTAVLFHVEVRLSWLSFAMFNGYCRLRLLYRVFSV